MTLKSCHLSNVLLRIHSVGLYHTAGLSTPQQIMEVLFAFTHLIHRKEADPYFEACGMLLLMNVIKICLKP